MSWLPASYTRGRRTRRPPVGLSQRKLAGRNHKDRDTKSVFRLSRFSRIPTRGEHDTYKFAPAYAPRSSLHTCAVTARSVFRCLRRRMHHIGPVASRIQIEHLPHGAQLLVTYGFPVNWMFVRHCRHVGWRHVGYSSAPHLIRTRQISNARIMRPRFCADACSFVRHCLRGPAYVSSIHCAYSLTAGKGPCPFEPRKGRESGEAFALPPSSCVYSQRSAISSASTRHCTIWACRITCGETQPRAKCCTALSP